MIERPSSATGGLRVGILGPLAVMIDNRPAAIAGDRLRTLLARLALDAGRPVRSDELIDVVWGDRAPSGPDNALQTLVSRLRRALPPDVLTAEPGGYRLAAGVDSDEFEQAVRVARTAVDPVSAADAYAAALALWRGDVLEDLTDAAFADATSVRLTEARAAATEEWLSARLAVEAPDGVVGDVEAFTNAYPLRERGHVLLIQALHGAGRQADAVGAYERIRARLADELGLDPSPDLAEAYRSMLRGATPGNLRPALTSFVGRTADLDRLVASLHEQRLVTLVGPGGAGKTRLAMEAARTVAGDYDGGVWMVELAPVREDDAVARALADTLHIRDARFLDLTASADLLDKLLGALTAKRLLLVLDNCEHVIEACARLVEPMLAACPAVHVLATSREPLAITGEALLPVGPLAVPVPNATTADARSAAAVELFAQRAAAVRPGFAISDANVAAVTEICQRLDGMPLAIELACARLRTMPVQTVADRLDDRFRLLTGGSRTALPRHQTLQAVVDWSWDLLGDGERDLAGRFSVFLDGATWNTVTDMYGPDSGQTLTGLVEKSFVQLGDDARYRMLETIRTYAAERLADAGTAAAARSGHATYFAATAHVADEHMRGAGQVRWLRWLSDE
ncbi:MAG TPA: BTAD domain-containing putative transcriptional regulator, partial [Micromonosporaceae bacterium]